MTAPVPYGMLPPEINSGWMYTGVGSGPLVASSAAWQALAAQLGSAGAAFQAVVEALVTGPWLGPSSISMAAAAAPYVVWQLATAANAEEAAAAASNAAAIFEAAHAGVVPPAEIEENRTRLATLIATNFMGVNAIPIAVTEADYDRMWAQDGTVMHGYSADAAAVTSSLVPFVPPLATTNPAGLAEQAAAVGQASGQAAGNASQQVSQTTMSAGGSPAESLLTTGPQLMGAIPQVLQGLSQPLTGVLGAPMQGLGQFQSLLSPLMGGMGMPGLSGFDGAAVAAPALAAEQSALGGGLGGLGGGFGGGGAAVSAALGRAGSLGGLSVPATWAASAQNSAAAAGPLSAPGASAPAAGAPASAGGAGMAGAPMAAMAGRENSPSGEPRYGTPVKVLPRQR
jgi:PPE-repeat protein